MTCELNFKNGEERSGCGGVSRNSGKNIQAVSIMKQVNQSILVICWCHCCRCFSVICQDWDIDKKHCQEKNCLKLLIFLGQKCLSNLKIISLYDKESI